MVAISFQSTNKTEYSITKNKIYLVKGLSCLLFALGIVLKLIKNYSNSIILSDDAPHFLEGDGNSVDKNMHLPNLGSNP